MRYINLTVAVFLFYGCGPASDSGKARIMPDSPDRAAVAVSDWLRITTNEAAIRQAREAALQFQRKQFEDIFEQLANRTIPDSETTQQLKAHGAAAIARLEAVLAPGEVTDESIGAALLLCHCEELAGRDHLRIALESGSDQQRNRILTSFGFLGDEAQERLQTFLFADEPLVSQLLSQLDDPNPAIVKQAIQCCGYLRVPGTHDRLIKMLDRPDVPNRGRILFWLSKGELTEELFAAVAAAFDPTSPDDRWGISVFEAFAVRGPQALRAAAKDKLRAAIQAWPDEGEIGYDGGRLSILSALAKSAEPADSAWLRELAHTESGLYARDPFVAWVQLQPPEGRHTLLRWLNDDERRKVAIDAAGQLYAGTADAEIINHLSQLAENAAGNDLERICTVLLKIGGEEAHQAIAAVEPRLDPSLRASYRQQIDRTSFSEMIGAVRDANLLTDEELEAAAERLSSKPQSGSTPSLFDLVATPERMVAFDVETGMLPCRHDELIDDFAKASLGKFRPEATYEVWHQSHENDYEAPYTLQFIAGGRLYQGTLRNYGDWYDVERTVTMINTALADSGLPERFVALEPNGQLATFVFAAPDRLHPLAERFHLALSNDPNAAMERGIASERAVIETLENASKE